MARKNSALRACLLGGPCTGMSERRYGVIPIAERLRKRRDGKGSTPFPSLDLR